MDEMADRYSKRDAVAAFERLAKALDKPIGHYESHSDEKDYGKAPEGSILIGDGSSRTIPGGWVLDWNPTYGGGVVEELVPRSTGVTHPLGSRRRNAREFCEAVDFALRVLEQAR